jgi:hypothetical protein
MQFIKNHYEKILLGAVLLGLVGTLVGMWFVIEADKQRMRDITIVYFPSHVEKLPDLDLAREDAAMKRLAAPLALDFSTTNKLFNPVQWQMDANHRMIKSTQLGPDKAVITKITPLYYIINLVSATTNELGARYAFRIEDEAATYPMHRRPRPHYASVGDKVTDTLVGGKDEGFTLVDVKGPLDDPTAVDLKLTDTGQTVAVAKDKPYRHVDGYTADLKYEPENNFKATGLRVGSHVQFAGDSFNIIAIEQNAVVMLAQSNQKKWTLPYAP